MLSLAQNLVSTTNGAQRPSNVVQLRSIFDNIMVQVRGLEYLGISSKKYGSLLIPVIMSRMPTDISLQVSRKTSEDIWQVAEITEIIRREIEARETSLNVRCSVFCAKKNILQINVRRSRT